MDHVADFPDKLDVLLKAATLSRVALAQRLGIDKSLVGRWLSGAVHPGEHNLARLSTVLAETFPQFRMSDWFDDIEVLVRRHGVEWSGPAVSNDWLPLGPLAPFIEAARPEIAFRGAAYEGFWRTSRPSLLVRDQIFHDYGMIRRSAGGMLEVRMEGSGLSFDGWLFPAAGNIFVFLFDGTGRTPMSLVFKGVSLPRAMVLDGILLLAALDANRTPAALPIVIERVGDLCGDPDVDADRYRDIAEQKPEPLEPLSRERLVAHLYRDFGPAAALAGGEPFLSVSAALSLTRGVAEGGLQG